MLAVFLFVVSLVSVEGWSEGPCLGYDVFCTTADYQLRRYNESVWVGIHAGHGHNVRSDSASLHRYLRGGNSEGMQIQSTGQVLVSFTKNTVLAIYILLPGEVWDNPPTTTNPQVFIARFPMMDVFSRTIPWFHFTHVADFNRTLTEQNVTVNNVNFFVSYCTGKEMWFVATGGFDCPAP